MAIHIQVPSTIYMYVNGLLEYQDRYVKTTRHMKLKERSILEILDLTFAYGCTFVATFWLPFGFVFGIHWFNPCKASITFHRFLHECSNKKLSQHVFLETISKTLILLVDMWRWMFCMSNASFSVSVILILCTWTLKENLQM